ncbi:MAG: cytochrome c maturation protein CcmE [Gammaproteobacteria bacterium]|nr:cytochrome c maturation protein CcmE [Gammaproteobacteria bacterium]
MRKLRQRRLAVVLFVVGGATATLSLALLALQENVDLFYEPARVTNGDAPLGVPIRAGGMVVEGSVAHDREGLGVAFSITDHAGHEFDVYYVGLLPDLFKEGKGIMVRGQLTEDGLFKAHEVLAKHDENYVPHEIHDMVEAADLAGGAQVVGTEPS